MSHTIGTVNSLIFR